MLFATARSYSDDVSARRYLRESNALCYSFLTGRTIRKDECQADASLQEIERLVKELLLTMIYSVLHGIHATSKI